MENRECKVCGGHYPTVDRAGRCRGCRLAKLATDTGQHYGDLRAKIFSANGKMLDDPTEAYGDLPCPVCGRYFTPGKASGPLFCSPVCAGKFKS